MVDGNAGINLEAIYVKNIISIIATKKKVIQFSRITCFISSDDIIFVLTITNVKKIKILI